MTRRLPSRRPSAPLVISLLALFVALGGTGVAQDVTAEISAKIKGKRIAKNAVKSKHIRNGAVRSPDIRNGTVAAADLAPDAVPDAYTKSESDGKYQPAGSYLAAGAKAADADTLDGRDSTDFMVGDSYGGAAVDVPSGENADLFTIPGALTVRGQCVPTVPPTPQIRLRYLTTFDRFHYERFADDTDGGVSTLYGDLDSDTGLATFSTDPGVPVHLEGHLVRMGAGSRIIDVDTYGNVDDGDLCQFSGTATDQGG